MRSEVLIFREAIDPLQGQMIFVPEHTELFFVRECDNAVWKIGNELLKLREGDVVLVPGGIPHDCRIPLLLLLHLHLVHQL